MRIPPFSAPQKILLIFFVLVAIICAVLYRQAFSAYFFQDDWYSFSISTVEKLSDIFNFFLPKTALIYYRPLGMQFPFFIFRELFGLNPLPFRLATLAFHLVNVFLVTILIEKLTKNKTMSFMGAFLYAVSATQFTIFYWAATIAFVIAPFFYFSAFLTYLYKKNLLSLALFFMGIFVNELLITLPMQLTLYELLILKTKRIKLLSAYWLLALAYISFRLTIARFATTGSYQFISSIQELFVNLRDYLLWSFNFPENIGSQFINFFLINPVFLKEFAVYVVFPTIALVMFGLITILAITQRKKMAKFSEVNHILFGITWFLIALSPVFFFKHHAYTYYLPIPLFGLLLVLSKMFMMFKEKRGVIIILGVLLFSWTAGSFTTNAFNVLTHWAPQRAERSKMLIEKVTQQYPILPQGAAVVIDQGNSEENKHALSDQHALQEVYQDPSIETYYGNYDAFLRAIQSQVPAQIITIQ